MGESECPITGNIDIVAHLYEGGNVSFKANKEYTGKATLGVYFYIDIITFNIFPLNFNK